MNDSEKSQTVKLQVLLTGNELMSGTTADTNSAMMAEKLAAIGIGISRKVTIGDEMDLLVHELKSLSEQSDVLLVNGGLGPTIDDLTAEALALASGQKITRNSIAIKHLEQWCAKLNTPLNDANLKQAMLPDGVEILANPTGSAVGFSLNLNDCLILCTPGVPSELRGMMDIAVLPVLQQRFPQAQIPSVDLIQCFGLGESTFQQKVDDNLPDWPKEVELSFRAGAPTLEIKLTIFSDNDKALKNKCKKDLYNLFGDYLIAEGKTTIAESLVSTLKEHDKHITFAESCTGGLMASMLTEVAGASQVFEAGFVTYSNEIKHNIIDVSEKTLQAFGAVSENVATEMLHGALNKSGADYGVAVSGIAGPDGGSQEKPVGTVCIAWGSGESFQTTTLQMPRTRKMFQLMVAATGFDLIRRDLLGITTPPRYFGRRVISTDKSSNKF